MMSEKKCNCEHGEPLFFNAKYSTKERFSRSVM